MKDFAEMLVIVFLFAVTTVMSYAALENMREAGVDTTAFIQLSDF